MNKPKITFGAIKFGAKKAPAAEKNEDEAEVSGEPFGKLKILKNN